MTPQSTLSQRVAKMLHLAENASTPEEAEAFLTKAQKIAAANSIDIARARHALQAKERTTPVQRTIHLGQARTHGLNTLVSLFNGIASANDVTVDVAHNSTYVVAFGFSEDIDVAEALYASLTVQMAEAVTAYRETGDWKRTWTETVPYRISTGRRLSADYLGMAGILSDVGEREVTRSTRWTPVRLDFQEGYARRVRQRLSVARAEAEDAAVSGEKTSSTGIDDNLPISTSLVLVEKREQVADFYASASSARGSYRYRTGQSSSAMGAGRSAANSARIGGTGSLSGARKALAS